MSIVETVSMIGVLFGIEFTLRFVDYLYTRKSRCLGSDTKHKRNKKKSKTYRKNDKND